MSRRLLVAGNWKLHLAPSEAADLARTLCAHLDAHAVCDAIDVAVFPTAFAVDRVVGASAGVGLQVGTQWTSAHTTGAFTGANSAAIARSIGCTWALAGHSEVRRDLQEGDEQVGASLQAALSAGLLPLLCIGETLDERDAGGVAEVLERQLHGALKDLVSDQVATCAIAYEPVWAIGTGRTASVEQAQDAHAVIRAWLRTHHPAFVGNQVRVVYGGSVKAENTAELLRAPDIDGVLVGGASLTAPSFLAIVDAACSAAQKR